jgi:hypothetical protein
MSTVKEQLNPLFIDDFSGGVKREVSRYKMPENTSPYAVNFIFDEEIGKAKVRKGTSMIGSQIVDNKPVLGLFNIRRRADTNHSLIAVVSDGTNNDIYTFGAWTKSLQDDTKDLKTRFVSYLDNVLRVNGTDSAKSWVGTGAWDTTAGFFDLNHCPQGSFVENFKDRIHILSKDGILYSSSVPRFFLDYDGQSANFNVGARVTGGTSGATGIIYKDTDSGTTGTLEIIGITGTFANNETITDNGDIPGSAVVNLAGSYKISWTDGYITTLIDPDNGKKGEATGLGKIGGLLFIFFERACYTWNGSSTQADEIMGIGCSSQESVAMDKTTGVMFFANENGVFMTNGGFPIKISRWVDEFFSNMSTSNYQHIAGGCDGKHYFCSIGDVAIDGKTISNVVLRYTISSQEWAILSYPTQPRVFSQYIDGTAIKLVYGDNDGNVVQIDSTAENDNFAATTSYPITFEIQTRDIFNDFIGMNKTIKNRVVVSSEKSSGAVLFYRADTNKNRQEDWKPLGEIKKDIQEFKKDSINYKVMRFKVSGRSIIGRFTLECIEIPDIINNGY